MRAKFEESTKRFFKPVIGGIFGLTSVFISLCFEIAVLISTPDFNYSEKMISELGIGPGSMFFNLGLIICGIIAIPFYISLGNALSHENVNEKTRKKAIYVSIFSCITFSLIGCFPIIPDNIWLLLFHGIFVFLSISSAIIYCILFSVLMLKNPEFSKFQAYLGFFAAGIYILFLCTWHPITEWLMLFALIPFLTVNSLDLIYRRKTIKKKSIE